MLDQIYESYWVGVTSKGANLTDCSSLALLELPSGSTGEWSVGGSLAWEGGQSEDELCWGAGVDAAECK